MANISINTTELLRLLEITPHSLRLRKRILSKEQRLKQEHRKKT